MIRGHDPNRIKGLNRVNRLLKNIPKKTEHLHDRNNSSTRALDININVAIINSRLNNITMLEMGFGDIPDHNRRAKTYYNILSGLYLLGKPSTHSQLMAVLSANYQTTKPVINKLLTAGYIREKRAAKQTNFKGSCNTLHFAGLEITAKGLDRLTFITSLLVA